MATELIERVMGEMGFVLLWSYEDHWVDVKAYEIKAHDQDGNILWGPDFTQNFLEAEVYLQGYVKWDGCSNIEILETHLCGAFFWKKQCDLLRIIHDRAFELMERTGEDVWPD